MTGEARGMPDPVQPESGRDDGEAAPGQDLLALGTLGLGGDGLDGHSLVEGDVVAGVDKVLEGDAVLGLDVAAVLHGEVLLGQLVVQLELPVFLPVGIDLGDFFRRDFPHPVFRSTD